MTDHDLEAISVFKLATALFPARSNAFDCLGEAYQQHNVRHLNVLRAMPSKPKAKG